MTTVGATVYFIVILALFAQVNYGGFLCWLWGQGIKISCKING